jgi:hypothetical protein
MLGHLFSDFKDIGKNYAGMLASKPSSEIDSTESEEDIM